MTGRYYRAIGFSQQAHAHERKARRAFACWGAHALVPQAPAPPGSDIDYTDEPAGDIESGSIASSYHHTYATTYSESSSSANHTLDIATVIQVSELLTREIVLDRLIKEFLGYLMKTAGADRAALLLVDERDTHVVAVADGDRIELVAEEPLDTTERQRVGARIRFLRLTFRNVPARGRSHSRIRQ